MVPKISCVRKTGRNNIPTPTSVLIDFYIFRLNSTSLVEFNFEHSQQKAF